MTTPTETITIENVVGSTDIDQELDLEQLGEDLTGVKYDPEQFPGLVVASVDFGTQFNLNAIAIGLGLEDVEYEPEQFPGLVYRLEDPSAVALLFGSGRAVITGAKTTDAVAHTTNAVETRLTDLGLFQ